MSSFSLFLWTEFIIFCAEQRTHLVLWCLHSHCSIVTHSLAILKTQLTWFHSCRSGLMMCLTGVVQWPSMPPEPGVALFTPEIPCSYQVTRMIVCNGAPPNPMLLLTVSYVSLEPIERPHPFAPRVWATFPLDCKCKIPTERLVIHISRNLFKFCSSTHACMLRNSRIVIRFIFFLFSSFSSPSNTINQ